MTQGWTEQDSRDFQELANVAVPGRDEQAEMLLSLIPGREDESFHVVELACGEGILAERLLDRYPHVRWLGLDGSPSMLSVAGGRLGRFGERAALREFDFTGAESLEGLPDTPRCIVSSLAVHHLTDDAKSALYRSAARIIEPGGALIIADVVLPGNAYADRTAAAAWHSIAHEQSVARTGSTAVYERAVAEGWGPPDEPEPGEMPARLEQHFEWLRSAGFSYVDCFWRRAGIAIYGGYR